MTLIVRLSAALWAAVLVAPTVRAQAVVEVQITPETMTLAAGERQTLLATAYDRQGNLIPNARFTFWSSDTLVATVGPDGSVTGLSAGLAKVEARAEGRQATTAVLITDRSTPSSPAPQGASTLAIEPAEITLLPGESRSLEIRALREDGGPAPAGRVRWKALRPDIATVDSAGLVSAVAPGQTMIQATSPAGAAATVPVEVLLAGIAVSDDSVVMGPGEQDTLRVVVPGQGGREIRGGAQWHSTDTAVVRVGPTGIVSALAPGRAEVVVEGFGQERRTAVLVHREPSTLVVTPPPGADPMRLPVGGVRRITAAAEAADSAPIPEARVAWAVGDTSVVSYDSATGELTGRALGATTLTARLRGFDPVVWNVQVTP